MSVRVRYAPSPTGLQHIGGVRTALFNYLYARSLGGTFILRIEDTDRERYQEDALQDIYDTFRWLGINWDEGPDVGGSFGPYFQSERKEIYQKFTGQLLETGKAYRCYCAAERLARLRENQAQKKSAQGYDRHCLNLTVQERARLESLGERSVIRLKVPLEGKTAFNDLLLGDIERANEDVNPDPVLLKSDGFPTYHLANVIDDHLMQVTHILRAQEWIPTVPVHVILYRAFEWEPPVFCHLPMVMGQDGQKLSKRHGSTSIVDFRKLGYLPEALINHIALLGWSYDESREIFALRDLEKLFSLEKLNKAPAVFDYRKLEWFNGIYIREKTDASLKALIEPYLKKAGLISDPPTPEQERIVSGAVPIIKERLKLLSDASELVGFLLKEVETYQASELIPKKLDRKKTMEALEQVLDLLEGFERLGDEENERRFRETADALGVKLGDLMMPLRVAVTGSRVSPPLFESIRLLGVERAKQRVMRAMEALRS
ncbi:MAG TPA: glutamate--tRNA ligase [Spirochaetia bacterium]|nr:glutamate--tRNA ligase [Spirochaetia bacterium]